MATFRYNLDVLYTIMVLTETRKDLLAFMKTSNALYSLGIPLLLKERVTLSRLLSLESFRDFMFAEQDQKRFRFLRALEIRIAWGEDQLRARESVILLLQNADFLRYLSVVNYNDIVGSPTGYDALQTLCHLRSLEYLSISDTDTAPILDSLDVLQSPVTELEIWSSKALSHSRIFTTLLNFKETLTKLTFKASYLTAAESSPVLPRVRELTIITDSGLVAYVGTLARVFPNLRRLSIGGGECASNANLLGTLRSNITQFSQAPQQWASLESISGDLPSLVALGLRCPIAQITATRLSSLQSHMFLLGTILTKSGPSILGLHATHDKFEGWALDTFRTLLRGLWACLHLSGLYLEIDIKEYIREHLTPTWVCPFPIVLTLQMWMSDFL